MRIARQALRELRGAEFLYHGNSRRDPMDEIAGLLSGALLGSALWFLLLRLTWFS